MIHNNRYFTLQKVSWQKGVAVIALVCWSIFMLYLCWKSGILHDYRNYISQWRLLLDGVPPWSTDNAYGPFHIILGYLLPFGSLVPKLFMVGMLLLANALLVFELIRERGVSRIQFVYLLSIPTNILLVGMGVIYGLNDAIVASLIILAVLLKHGKHSIAAGAFIGVAALIKFYPLVLLPFFALDDDKLDLSLFASGAMVFLVGFAGSIILWGDGPITAILFNSDRGPKLLSILAPLQKVFGDNEFVGFLIQQNTKFVLIGVFIAFIFAWKNKLNWLEGGTLGYLVMLTLYKVGHQQFYIPLLCMIACLPLLHRKTADFMALALIPLALFLSLYQFGYQFLSDNYHTELIRVRNYGGIIAFMVNMASIAAICLVCTSKKIRDWKANRVQAKYLTHINGNSPST